MSYILELRQHVGLRPLISVGSTIVPMSAQREVLLQRRSDTGGWGTLGGSMELGESFEENTRRELLEEAGLSAGTLELLGLCSGEEYAFTYPNGDQIYNAAALFLCFEWTGEPTISDAESLELRFFALDDLPEIAGPPDKMALELLKVRFGNTFLG